MAQQLLQHGELLVAGLEQALRLLSGMQQTKVGTALSSTQRSRTPNWGPGMQADIQATLTRIKTHPVRLDALLSVLQQCRSAVHGGFTEDCGMPVHQQ